MALPKALSADEWKQAEAATLEAFQFVTADGREVGVVSDFARTGFAAYTLAGTTAVSDVNLEQLRAAWTRYTATNKVVAAMGVLAAEARVRDGASAPVTVVATAALTRETLALDKVTRDVLGTTQPTLRGMQALPSPYLLQPPAAEPQAVVWRHVETPDACPYYALVCLTPVLVCVLGYDTTGPCDALMERVARLEPHVYGTECQERFTAAMPSAVCVPLDPGTVLFLRRAVPVALMPAEGSDFYAVKSVVFGPVRRTEQWRAAISTGAWTADAFDEHFFMRSVPLLKAPPSPPLFAPLARPEDVPWLISSAAGGGRGPAAAAAAAAVGKSTGMDKKRVAVDENEADEGENDGSIDSVIANNCEPPAADDDEAPEGGRRKSRRRPSPKRPRPPPPRRKSPRRAPRTASARSACGTRRCARGSTRWASARGWST